MLAKDVTICGHGSGTPSLKNMQSYCAKQYSLFATNGVRKGLVCVRRLREMTDDGRIKFHDTYKTILGRNRYNQNLRQYVYTKNPKTGYYYSDCSSSICATYRKIGYTDVPLTNTAGIYENNDLFETVAVKIKDGQITNPDILKVGDCLLFKGNDPKRPLQIGHVEAVYELHGQVIPDTGDSTKKVVKDYQTWLNRNYKSIVFAINKDKLLTVDGEYGDITRRATLAVWKYMSNKYNGTKLVISNKNFGVNCKKAANGFILELGYTDHPTLTWLLQGILVGRGYYGGPLYSSVTRDVVEAIIRFQKQRKLTADGICGPDTWYALFN